MLNIKDTLGALIQKAVNYLQAFWKQLMAWRHDGNYSIDNNVIERAIRPITLQRKSSLQFGSAKGLEISSIYHTIIENCKLSGISPRLYLKRFFQEIAKGRTDYVNLLPSTIGRIKKIKNIKLTAPKNDDRTLAVAQMGCTYKLDNYNYITKACQNSFQQI